MTRRDMVDRQQTSMLGERETPLLDLLTEARAVILRTMQGRSGPAWNDRATRWLAAADLAGSDPEAAARKLAEPLPHRPTPQVPPPGREPRP